MKLIRTYIIILAVLTRFGSASAQQHTCGSDAYYNKLLNENPQLQKSVDEYNEQISSLGGVSSKQFKKGTTRIIPVVFHIIHTYGSENISKAQIEDQLRIMNLDFQRMNSDTVNTRSTFKTVAADMDIEFRLARIDPNGNCTEGITRTYSPFTDGGDDKVKSLIRWDYRKYLNIWIVKNIAMDAGSGGRVLGYATLPAFTNSTTDGIVMLSDYVGSIGTASGNNNKGRVLVHEVGHWLGLYHPFQNGCGNNCSNSGDYVCDTPPVSAASFGCPTTNNTCKNDSPDLPDQIENFMDYANGACQNMFTKGQKAIVDNSLGNTAYRARNIASANLTATGVMTNPSCAPIADFYTSNGVLTVCQGQKVTFKNYTYNGTADTYAWAFDGGTPSASAASDPVIQYNSPGIYKVKLTASNTQGSSEKTFDQFIRVIPSTAEISTPFAQGFDDLATFTGKWNIMESGDYGWVRNTAQKFDGSAGMKAFIDNGSLTNSTYNLISPAYDISTIKGRLPKLKFKVAYRPAVTGSTEVLTIWVSKDCGQTWVAQRAFSNNNGLGVDKVVEPGWAPSSQADWKDLTVDLVAFESVKNLMFRFEARSRSGNSIYLDNVNVEADLAAGINNYFKGEQTLKVYPNPSNGRVTIDINLSGRDPGEFRIINSIGQVMTLPEGEYQQNGTGLQYTVNNLPAGVYFATLNIEGQKSTVKFTVLP